MKGDKPKLIDVQKATKLKEQLEDIKQDAANLARTKKVVVSIPSDHGRYKTVLMDGLVLSADGDPGRAVIAIIRQHLGKEYARIEREIRCLGLSHDHQADGPQRYRNLHVLEFELHGRRRGRIQHRLSAMAGRPGVYPNVGRHSGLLALWPSAIRLAGEELAALIQRWLSTFLARFSRVAQALSKAPDR